MLHNEQPIELRLVKKIAAQNATQEIRPNLLERIEEGRGNNGKSSNKDVEPNLLKHTEGEKRGNNSDSSKYVEPNLLKRTEGEERGNGKSSNEDAEYCVPYCIFKTVRKNTSLNIFITNVKKRLTD